MTITTITPQDVARADAFLDAYLRAKIPDADFGPGSVNRDFTVKAIAYIFAYLEAEREKVRKHQSLRELAKLEPSESVDDAVDALLSNHLITRKSGTKARVSAVLHFSRSATVTLRPGQRFFKEGNLAFVPDIQDLLVIPASDLRRVIGVDGSTTEYTCSVTLVALNPGDDYNIPPGPFTGADAFNPFFMYAENTSDGYDGRGVESTQELLARAPEALSVRNLVNERAIAAVLKDRFNPRQVLTVGFGDPEMIRDIAGEAASRLEHHSGGYTDIYVDLGRTEVAETLRVGGPYTRPDGVANTLKDSSVDFLANTPPVKPGQVLRIFEGLSGTAREFAIAGVTSHTLTVAPRAPFAAATDEADPVTYVSYSVGYYAPKYSDVLPPRSTGITTRAHQEDSTVLLEGRPHYQIKRVEVLTGDGNVTILGTRVADTGQHLDDFEYAVATLNPAAAQSRKAVTRIRVSETYENRDLRVVYETVTAYDEIQQYVTNRYERVLCSNPLVKAFNPVYLQIRVPCRPLEGIDPQVVARGLAEHINSYSSRDPLDVVTFSRYLRNNFPQMGAIYDPLSVTYTLHGPDGNLYEYSTKDLVTLHPGPDNGASLLSTKAPDLRALGVSDRTIRFIADASLISIDQR